MAESHFERYFEMSERTGWRTTDLDWRKVDVSRMSEFDRQALLATAIIEHGVPHYSDTWARVEGLQAEWELWQFAVLWAGEEHRHAFSLKKLADMLEIESNPEWFGEKAPGAVYYDQIAKSGFGAIHKEHCACYATIPGMLTYTTIQELATWKYYEAWSRRTQSAFLKELLGYIAKDEAKHHAYYADALRRHYDKAEDKQSYVDAVFEATMRFEMPHLIYPTKVAFFERTDTLGTMDHWGMKMRMAKVFSFSKDLLKRLAATAYGAGARDLVTA